MKKSVRHRPERLARLIQETVANAIGKELKDPRVGFVTVTNVAVTPDLAHATVMVSVMGADDEQASAIAGLEHARGFLRTYLARNLSLRTAPELHFVLDRGLQHAARIDAILDQIKHDEPDS